jgi:hypothetical protein
MDAVKILQARTQADLVVIGRLAVNGDIDGIVAANDCDFPLLYNQ